MPSLAPPARSGGFSVIARGRWATIVVGESRDPVLRVAYAIASDIDSGFLWLDIRGPSVGAEEAGPGELGWIPSDRRFFTRELAEAAPQPKLDRSAVVRVVRADDQSVSSLTEFLRLPSITQEIAAELGASHERRVLVLANAERVRERYPGQPQAIRPFLDAQLSAGLIPLFAVRGSRAPGRMAFDFVFRVEVEETPRGRAGSLVVEKSPPGTPFHAGERIPLLSFPSIAESLARGRDRV
ncbi:MAG TPA: hypothetical protein VML53_02060 [Thermoplasmata archaeon]|nr:hypothetical protein [Thermoplasmata archaeon]